MRISRNVLNNMMMENQRRNPLYQTIITDLAITGNMDRDDAEMLLGYTIPAFLKTPDGKCFVIPKADEEPEEADEEPEEADEEPEEADEEPEEADEEN